MGNPPFIDVHVHPDIKTFLTADEERNRLLTCWDSVNLTRLIKLIDKILLGRILESQSNLSQLNNSSGTIAMVGLCALEKAMIKGDLVKIFGFPINLLTISKVLKMNNHDDIINYGLLKSISSWRYCYHTQFKKEEHHLNKSKDKSPGYNPLSKINDYDQAMLNIVFTIEGGHNLFNKTFGCKYKQQVLNNLQDLKDGSNRYLFMSLAHLARNRLATHAFGMKLLYHRNFKPVGYGIRKIGKEVIKLALSKPHRILIDIKHLSLESRKQYYNILKTEYGQENIPIIASHAGVTGVSYNNMPIVRCSRCWRWIKVQYCKPAGLMDTKFNPWSVNLYDEEIKTIVDSKGLIGLSLDERILGTKQKRKAQLTEYFSAREFSRSRCRHLQIGCEEEPEPPISDQEQHLHEIEEKLRHIFHEFITNPQQVHDLENPLNDIEVEYVQVQEDLGLTVDDGIKHLCNNILHIVKVAGNKGLKHISIGSDFDGFVDAVKGCKNSTEYNSLSKGLKKWLPHMAADDQSLPPLTNIDQIVADIMFGNAYEFLKVNFT